MTRHKWTELRDMHLQTPEQRVAYDRAKEALEVKLAVYYRLEELVPDSTDLSELWEAIDELREDDDPDSLRRRLWALVHDRGLTDSPTPPPIEGSADA